MRASYFYPDLFRITRSKTRLKSAVLHVIALAHYAIVSARARAADSINARVRLAAQNDRLHEECALLREELRIKDVRTAQIEHQRRPHHGPLERMAILELRAVRGWSLKQTADTFFLTSATIASWMKRIDQEGPDALLQLREPVNKFPDFVRYIVQRLKTLSPSMGKVRSPRHCAGQGCIWMWVTASIGAISP